ncbi:hypothetical protein BOG92_015945 [Streptomyces sp. WAC00263]|nr:hypothetical protein BOG92_015945 [Streptomyces sp. WAC00263]
MLAAIPAESVPEPGSESVCEPGVECLPEPRAESASEASVESFSEPGVESVPEPRVECVPEPRVEFVSELGVERLPEPRVEPLPEPRVERLSVARGRLVLRVRSRGLLGQRREQQRLQRGVRHGRFRRGLGLHDGGCGDLRGVPRTADLLGREQDQPARRHDSAGQREHGARLAVAEGLAEHRDADGGRHDGVDDRQRGQRRRETAAPVRGLRQQHPGRREDAYEDEARQVGE